MEWGADEYVTVQDVLKVACNTPLRKKVWV